MRKSRAGLPRALGVEAVRISSGDGDIILIERIGSFHQVYCDYSRLGRRLDGIRIAVSDHAALHKSTSL